MFYFSLQGSASFFYYDCIIFLIFMYGCVVLTLFCTICLFSMLLLLYYNYDTSGCLSMQYLNYMCSMLNFVMLYIHNNIFQFTRNVKLRYNLRKFLFLINIQHAHSILNVRVHVPCTPCHWKLGVHFKIWGYT
jgi:hypothetical protein